MQSGMGLNVMFCLHLGENRVTDKRVRFISGSVIYSVYTRGTSTICYYGHNKSVLNY